MTLDGGRRRVEKKLSAKGLAVAAAISVGAYGAGAYEGLKSGAERGAEKTLEQVNMHWMTPSAEATLVMEFGATNSEIREIESRFKEIMLQELERVRSRQKSPEAGKRV